MKIWIGRGSEHSANLVIIGSFKTEEDAAKAASLLRTVTETAREDEERGELVHGSVPSRFTETMLKVLSDTNFASFDHKDPVQLLSDYTVLHRGKQIVVTTEELGIEAIMKVLLHQSARLEVYSAHDYPSPYGRPTSKG